MRRRSKSQHGPVPGQGKPLGRVRCHSASQAGATLGANFPSWPESNLRMMSFCRLITDSAAGGAWNMAVDAALVESDSPSHGGSTLRFYQWREPTVSLGYFQCFADWRMHPLSQSCEIVRRTTGGGAIVHDRELTYSYVVEADRRDKSSAARLYDEVHGALIDTLKQSGIIATLCRSGLASGREQPFLCFARRSPGDVLIGDYKICGSAQRRVGGVVLQHGSVLLHRSPFAPELPGICELTGTEIQADELASRWTESLAGRLNLRFQRQELTAEERGAAKKWEKNRFDNPAWTHKK